MPSVLPSTRVISDMTLLVSIPMQEFVFNKTLVYQILCVLMVYVMYVCLLAVCLACYSYLYPYIPLMIHWL
jgi:hypothetical protein